MPETLDSITADLSKRVAVWLEQPDEASLGLQELRERLGALRSTLGATATSGALRELSGAEKSIRSSRQREATEAIASACRELGIILEAKAPLKRAPRKRSPRPAATVSQEAAAEGTASVPRERSSIFGRRAQ